MKNIKLFERVGSFAENKDIARDIRIKEIIPAIESGKRVVLDFSNIDAATQSFVHALISDLIRKYGNDILDKIDFKSCNKNVQKIIMIVSDYMQEGT
ncbi:MAG: hypothetical protein UR66_C0001G0080 [Candidatus Moranbacteria bacterium GW2011_GWE1_35_17]|nr:MAG: hypothetical protein UR66_C0001G0080 [Candidatus Moranbacteria bacterium GW2011_GWE1_35_17]KKP72745.1 MAG: hypothetical protein UR65_C0012G0010 [Candidatus Moranbacteria bacterium GW2011_GWE2_35_164]KKP81143.1 MAG: hypothetical protein UR82_C0071G0003 [Candidatus Moranbacteria bacterium GW2011_GWF1_35_5]KKP85201.1 MAG: hypothetical protein UR83_C0003G0036 [Candidatus Moranbacteria bacterium GW2011_GWF2_35_54]